MTDAYGARGFGSRRIGFGERPAVVVVDFQRGFTDAAFPLGGSPLVERAVTNTATLLGHARAAGLPVVSCFVAYHGPGDMPHWKIPAVLEEFRLGHPCTDLDPRVHDPAHDVVLVKRAPSIFFETGAAQVLVRNRCDTVVVTGCNTSGCVRASVVDAFSHGFRVIVPEPCVGDVDEGPHRANLTDIDRRYADVVDLATAITGLSGR